MLNKIVHAGVSHASFAQGSEDLEVLAEVIVPVKQVERLTRRIGRERCAERDAEVAAYQVLPLVERKAAPAGVAAPEVAVVGCDGGRLQIWPGGNADARDGAAEPLAAAAGRSGRHWREDKIGLLMTMQSEESASDPCPEIPESFIDPTRIIRLARELKKQAAPTTDDGVKEAEEPEIGVATLAEEPQKWQPPEVQSKRLLGTRCRWPRFGPLLATAAWQWGFFQAQRKAFLGDGSDNNWTIWRQYFSSFTAILDFIHALSYVFAAATAGRSFPEGWEVYVQWIGWVWQGEVAQVIAALAQRQLQLGIPDSDEAETSPRSLVARALVYLQNHKDQMRYPEYRRLGLPITSSYVESAVKQFNQRVKGTEKFWTEDGAESILQLRADHLSDHKPLKDFWERRQAKQMGQRRYCRAA